MATQQQHDKCLAKSFETIRERLEAIQQPIGEILDIGDEIYRVAAPDAPRPIEAGGNPITLNPVLNLPPPNGVPILGELLIRLADNRIIHVNQWVPSRTPSRMDALRHQFFSRSAPEDLTARTVLTDRSHRPGLPFNIETELYEDGGRFKGFIDLLYEDPEPILTETRAVFEEALRFVS